MTKLRRATLNDVETMVNYAEVFFNDLPYSSALTFDREKAASMFKHFIENEAAYLVLVFDGGAFVGGILPNIWVKESFASEIGFYTSRDSRGKTPINEIIKEFEKWSKDNFAGVTVFHLVGENPRDSFLTRKGFKPYEVSYWKE